MYKFSKKKSMLSFLKTCVDKIKSTDRGQTDRLTDGQSETNFVCGEEDKYDFIKRYLCLWWNFLEQFSIHVFKTSPPLANEKWKFLYNKATTKNKRPMGHIIHLWKQFISINTYDYIITLIEKKIPIINFMSIYWFFIWTNFNPLHLRMHCAKFGWNWPIDSGEEDW